MADEAYMPTFATASPFNPATGNAFRPNPYQQYQPYSGFPLAGYADFAMQFINPTAGQRGISYGLNQHVNLYNNLQYQMQTQRHTEVLQRAFAQDAPQAMAMAAGVYGMFGQEFKGDSQQLAIDAWARAGQLAGNINSPAALKWYDTILGGRTGMPLASAMIRASQQTLDPTTGGRFTTDAAIALSSQAQQHFFGGPGSSTNFAKSGGLTGYEMGELYTEMASSGKLPGLSQATDPKMGKWGNKEAGKAVNEALERYARVLGTVKEIFIGEGRTDVPIQKLMDVAESLTGGLQQMSGVQAEQRIRGVFEAAKAHGLGSEAVIAGMQFASQGNRAYGLNPAFDIPITEFGFQFRTAAEQTGIAAPRTPVWGLKSLDQLQAQATRQVQGFAASDAGQRLATISRLGSRYFGTDGKIDPTKITGNSPIERAMKAIAAGNTLDPDVANYLTGNQSTLVNDLAKATGMSIGQVGMEMQFKNANDQEMNAKGLQNFSVGSQRADFFRLIAGQQMGTPTALALGNVLGAKKADTAAGKTLGQTLTDVARNALMNATGAGMQTIEDYQGAMAKAMRDQLEADAKRPGAAGAMARDTLAGMTGSTRGLEGSLQDLAMQQWNYAESLAREQGMISGGGDAMINYLKTLDPTLAKKRQEAEMRNNFGASAASKLLGTVQEGWVGRLMSGIRGLGKGESKDPLDIVKNVIGANITGEQAAPMVDILEKLSKSTERYKEEKMKAYDAGMTTSDAAEAALKEATQYKEDWEKFINLPENKGLKEEMTKAAEEKAKKDATAGGGAGGEGLASNWTMSGVTIVLNGVELTKGATGKGTVGQGSRGGGATTTA